MDDGKTAAPAAATTAFGDTERDRIVRSFELRRLVDHGDLTRITDFAATLCGTRVALVSIVESDRQWFPARTGIGLRETPIETSFCVHAMHGDDIMVVPDATLDPRFSDNPLVIGEPHIRFYAGVPLMTDDGVPLGALCVIDGAPRAALTELQVQGLKVLAANVMTMLTLYRASRRSNHELDEQASRFRILTDAMPQMVWSTLPDGFHDYYNARWYEFTGVPAGSTDGEGWNGMFHPEDQARAWATWRHSLATGDPYEIEYRLRHASGEYRWTLGRAMPLRDRHGTITRWFGTCTDIHEHKMLQSQREIVAQELSHRIKNIFAVIGGLISLSTRHQPEFRTVADDLRERVLALGRAHDFVRPHSERSQSSQGQNSLFEMLRQLLGAYAERVAISGTDLTIDDRSATPLALVFHELATNAAKYGALSAPGGNVAISATIDGPTATLEWHEAGGPAIEAPVDTGFGTRLIELSAVRQLGGAIERDWLRQGLRVSLRIPVAAFHRSPTATE